MQQHSSQSGFSLIEMIVSLALFSVVVTIAVGALLALIATNRQLQAEQSVMTNLSFALDSMTREIRTGTSYFCDAQNNYNAARKIFRDGVNGTPATDVDSELGDETDDCVDGRNGRKIHGIAFKESGDSITSAAGEDRILYFFDEDENKIYRRVGAGQAQSIVSSGIYINDAEFYVTGSAPQHGSGATDDDQALVTIFIEASETDDLDKVYTIQTTITQRTLDI